MPPEKKGTVGPPRKETTRSRKKRMSNPSLETPTDVIVTGKRTGEEVETGGQSRVKKPRGRSRKGPAGVTGAMAGAVAAAGAPAP